MILQNRSEHSVSKQSNVDVSAQVPVNISGGKLVFLLVVLTAILLLMHLASYFVQPFVSSTVGQSLDSLFNLSRENNFPSYFSAFLLMMAALLFYITHKTVKQQSSKWKLHWWLLSLIMAFLSIDEAVQLHERLATIGGKIFAQPDISFLSFAWVIPYTILFLIVGTYFLPFVLALNKRTRKLFIIAGVFYVGGALGFEFLEGHEVHRNGHTFTYWLMVTIEEVMEMTGVIILIYALLDYLKQLQSTIKIT